MSEFPDTSKKALASIQMYSPTLRDVIRGYIVDMGGATCDEVEEILELRHQTASARIRELYLARKIDDSGERRATRSGRSAIIWKAKGAIS